MIVKVKDDNKPIIDVGKVYFRLKHINHNFNGLYVSLKLDAM
jgi:hypothetical protein